MSPRPPAKKLQVKNTSVEPEWIDREERPVPPPMPPLNTSLRLYRRLALGFVVLVATLLVAVVYVSSVKAIIHVVPVEETLSAEVLLDVVETPTRDHEITGKVLSGRISRSQQAVPSGEGGKEVEGVARGTVTLTNTTQKEQGLVATTRLLTADGVLFRIDEDVTVPAGGSVSVSAYADQPGKTGDIGPSRFTIPGLSVSLQSSIYGESTEPFTGGLAVVSAISQNDIDRAYADLKASLEEDAKTMLRSEAGGIFSGESFSSMVAEQKSSVEAGSEASTFEVTMTLEVSGVFFDREAARALAERALYAKVLAGKEFASINTDALQATVQKTGGADGSANVRVYLDGVASTSVASAALQPSRFAGMKESQVKQLLVDEGVAKDVSIEFSPSWISTVPRLKDHIYVEVGE